MKLVINAKDGIAYQASAILRDGDGQLVAEGRATLAPRGGLASVRPGLYKLCGVHELPRSRQVRHEWGTHGFIFESVDRSVGEPLLIHGGDMYTGSYPRAVHGSVRVDETVFDALLDALNAPSAQAQVRLSVQIGDAPRPWQIWRRPSATTRVPDQGLDMWDVVYPELARFRHPNSATAWLLYFRHADADHPKSVSGRGGDYAGGGASGAWSSEPVADARPAPETVTQEAMAHAPGIAVAAAPLFTISPEEGIDHFGRVEHSNSSEEPRTPSPPIGAALAAGLGLASSDELARDAHSAFVASVHPEASLADPTTFERVAAGGEAVEATVNLSTSY